MIGKTFSDILPLVQKPSRYLGNETNSKKKNLSRVRLKIALAFPDLYEIGTSHFGMQILYHILNAKNDIAAERVFAPGIDMEGYLRANRVSLSTLESHTPLNRFDIIGFSLLYELNFTNILTILDLAQIPFYSNLRDESYPLIIAGGPCTCNPEPLADFFDAFVIGDGEQVVLKISQKWIDWQREGKKDKNALLNTLSQIEGVYVPKHFDAIYDENGFQFLLPNRTGSRISIRRTIIGNLDQSQFPTDPVVSYGKPVHDRLRLELARGCTRGCRFCQAGMIYRPVRERSVETLINLFETAVQTTGYEELSLLSLSTGDYSCILSLMKRLMDRCEPRHISVSLPSLRAGTLTAELMRLIKRVRKTGFTIAPEAGSQRLRTLINKNITEKDIIDTVQNAFLLGWRLIKLYFMVGLPTETQEDLQSVVNLVEKLTKIKVQHRGGTHINVSVATFIPKPHTPFQWADQISLKESRMKIGWLQKHLKMPGVHMKWQQPETSFLEGVWARGDRRLSRLLVEAYKRGCRFDGWSDQFKFDIWERSCDAVGLDSNFFTTRKRRIEEPLPWDHIDIRVSKEFLIQEWKKAIAGQATDDCRNGLCNDCGVCDFNDLKPVVFSAGEFPSKDPFPKTVSETPAYHRLDVSYSKLEDGRFFGHLEMVHIFLRALRRAGIPVKYSEGFHPMPKISFEDPLPTGTESQEEHFYITVPKNVLPEKIVEGLKNNLPSGLLIQACGIQSSQKKKTVQSPLVYEVKINDGVFEEKALRNFNNREALVLTQKNKKGARKTIDLKSVVREIVQQGPHALKMSLCNEPGKRVRPIDIIKEIYQLPEEPLKKTRIVKLKTDSMIGAESKIKSCSDIPLCKTNRV